MKILDSFLMACSFGLLTLAASTESCNSNGSSRASQHEAVPASQIGLTWAHLTRQDGLILGVTLDGSLPGGGAIKSFESIAALKSGMALEVFDFLSLLASDESYEDFFSASSPNSVLIYPIAPLPSLFTEENAEYPERRIRRTQEKSLVYRYNKSNRKAIVGLQVGESIQIRNIVLELSSIEPEEFGNTTVWPQDAHLLLCSEYSAIFLWKSEKLYIFDAKSSRLVDIAALRQSSGLSGTLPYCLICNDDSGNVFMIMKATDGGTRILKLCDLLNDSPHLESIGSTSIPISTGSLEWYDSTLLAMNSNQIYFQHLP